MNRILLACTLLSVCTIHAQSFQWDNDSQMTAKSPAATVETITTGMALFYPDYYEGNPTALGETFHQNLLTAGHPSLPLGTMVRVRRPDIGLSTTVRINDRGAHCEGCAIYLSKAAAHELDMLTDGQVYVELDILDEASKSPATTPTPPQFTAHNATTEEVKLVAKGVPTPTPHTYSQPQTRINKPEPVASGTTTATNKIATPSLPMPGEKNSAATSTYQTIDTPISEYAVQLGSYRKYSNAERHLTRLMAQDFTCLYMLKEAHTDGGTLHRVIIAPFTTLAEAEQFVEDLALHRQMEALVLQTKWAEIGN